MKLLKLIVILICFVFLHSGVNAQEKMKTISGMVNDRYTFEAVGNVLVFTGDSLNATNTGEDGYYELSMPRKTKKIYFQHVDYYPEKIRLAFQTRKLDLRMKPVSQKKARYGALTYRNAIGWLPVKHLLGALGLRYERFLGVRYSVGLYLDWYYRGREFFGTEKYQGFKIAPAFRYYFRHHRAGGFYLQAYGLLGYFDFSELNYEHPYDEGNILTTSYRFWTGGVGNSIGAYFALGESRQAYIDINVGFQYLEANFPTQKNNNGTIYHHNNGWWYLGGPGSFIEVKLALGGLF